MFILWPKALARQVRQAVPWFVDPFHRPRSRIGKSFSFFRPDPGYFGSRKNAPFLSTFRAHSASRLAAFKTINAAGTNIPRRRAMMAIAISNSIRNGRLDAPFPEFFEALWPPRFL